MPFALDLLKDPVKHEMMAVASAPLVMGRPIAAPPGVPADRVAALRAALAETFKDADYLAECATLRLECDDPITAQTVTDGVARAYKATPEVVRQLQQIYQAGESK